MGAEIDKVSSDLKDLNKPKLVGTVGMDGSLTRGRGGGGKETLSTIAQDTFLGISYCRQTIEGITSFSRPHPLKLWGNPG